MIRSPIRPQFARPRLLAWGVAAALLLGWGTILGYRIGWYRTELGRAEREIAAGRYAPARARLATLSARWPGLDEVEYPLGTCEAALGNVEPALAAWARVPRTSIIAPRAHLDRAALALRHGRLAAVEESLVPILDAAGEIGAEAGRLADQLDLFVGRTRAISRRIERRWWSARDQAALLRMHWMLDTQPTAILAVRDALERMTHLAPDDDRIGLGLANLETRAGRFDEADRRLSRCEARRPGDADVAEARLAWALATGRPDAAAEASGRIDASRFDPAGVAQVAARLARLRGDRAAERDGLEHRVALDPGDSAAWERLADLAAEDGRGDLRDRYRKRKAELDRAQDQYRSRMGAVAAGDASGAGELARLAETLGRDFEARGWWTLAARRAPDDPEAIAALERLARRPAAGSSKGRTLADLVTGGRRRPTTPREAGKGHPAIPSPRVPAFRDDAEAAGLRFVYDNDPTPLRRLPETMGGGVGLLDFDGDGLLDVYAVQGGAFPPSARARNGDRLFRNRGDGTFADVTDASGLGSLPGGYGHGIAVGDVDNDGDPDLFVTRWRSYALYRNRGDGTFEDATAAAGLGGERGWPTSSAFADLDNDGDLDLYVCQYLAWDPSRSPPCPDPDRPGGHLYCVPRSFDSEPDRVFRNDGGRFVDVTEAAGVVDRDGRGLGVVAADVDDDGRLDLFVANDMTANFLFRNLGGFRFREEGAEAGVAANAGGGYQAGMGVAAADLDGDGRIDLAVTNFYGESMTLYRNLGGGQFADATAHSGLAEPSRYLLGFGLAALDADDDGRLDLATANGHVNDLRPAFPSDMPAQLLLGGDRGRFEDVSDRAGPPWRVPRRGRGLAAGDLDNDGRIDLLILSQGSPLAYFHNGGTAPPNHSLTLHLEGTASNRDAVGTRLSIDVGGRRRVAQRLGGGSFLSAGDPRIHVGLETATRVDSLEVRWPSGRVDRHRNLAADAAYRLREGDAHASPLRGWGRPGRSH